jgi:hypothetical protein
MLSRYPPCKARMAEPLTERVGRPRRLKRGGTSMKYEKPRVITTLTEREVFGADELMTSAWSNAWGNSWSNRIPKEIEQAG